MPIEAQQYEPCLTPDLTPAERNALWNGFNPGDADPAGGLILNIPLWLTYVVQTDNVGMEAVKPLSTIDEVNGYFNNGFHFYVCGITIIKNDEWYYATVNSSAGNPSERSKIWQESVSLNPNTSSNKLGFIDVLIVGGLIPNAGGYSGVPTGYFDRQNVIVKNTPGLIAKNIAHELGHYFGMSHTFAWGPTVSDPNHPEYAQYVSDNVILNNIPYNCTETGDGICDTPADPGEYKPNNQNVNYCDALPDCSSVECPGAPLDPLGAAYHPDPTNMMSYYLFCNYKFSPIQNNIMAFLYLNSPNYEFLRSPFYEPTVCYDLNVSDIGYIRRTCQGFYTSSGILQKLDPLKDDNVTILDDQNAVCSPIPNNTDPAGKYSTYSCIYPDFTGVKSILPDKYYTANMNLNIYDPVVNGVDEFDFTRILKRINGVEPLNAFQMIAADVDNSGFVTTYDVWLLKKRKLNNNTFIPAGSWRYIPEYCFEDPTFVQEFFEPEPAGCAYINTDPALCINPFNAHWTDPNGNIRTYGATPNQAPILPNTTSWMDHVTLDPASPAAQNAKPWSFLAVKVGDVDCTASTATATEPPVEEFVSPGHNLINSGQIFYAEITTPSNISLEAWQLGIQFDPLAVQVVNIESGSAPGFDLDNFGTTQVAEGQIKALWYSETGQPLDFGNKSLFKVKLQALKPIAHLDQVFNLQNKLLLKQFVGANEADLSNIPLELYVNTGALSMNGITTGAGHVTSNIQFFPSPITNEVDLVFSTQKDARWHLTIFDGLGRVVANKSQAAEKGTQNVHITELTDQSAGLYWYQLDTGEQIYSGKLIKS